MERTANSGESLNAEKVLRLRRGTRTWPLPELEPGYPKATLFYEDKVIDSAVAQDLGGSKYRAIVTVPRYEGTEPVELTLLWEALTKDGKEFQWEDSVLIDNHQRQTELKEPVILNSDESISFYIPRTLTASDTCKLTINDPRGDGTGQTYIGTVRPLGTQSELVFATQKQMPSLKPNLALLEFTDGSQQHRTTSNYWVINPSILSHANRLQGWLDKARVQNTIPELRFELPDMLLYLANGLDTFNSYAPSLTSFTGINATGVVADLWQLCSAWYMCRSQWMAEGVMEFDFNGQAVTLSINRAQYWEQMASALEAQMNERVPKGKGLLGRSGITGGDGDTAKHPFNQQVGFLGLTRHPVSDYRNFWR